MNNEQQEPLNKPTISSKSDINLQELEEQVSQLHIIVEQQKQQNKQLKEKMILQEQLNTQLSNFHLTSYFQDKENQTLSTKKEEELSKAQEHIMILGHMLLKNKKTIQKLKKIKIKDESLCLQIADLIKEKNFLWDIVLQVHKDLTQQPHLENECKEDKATEVMTIINNKNKKLKP